METTRMYSNEQDFMNTRSKMKRRESYRSRSGHMLSSNTCSGLEVEPRKLIVVILTSLYMNKWRSPYWRKFSV
jgi:hypothetical protein